MSPPTTANVIPAAAAWSEIDRQLEQSGWVIQDPDQMNIYAARGVAVREVKLKKGHGKVLGTLFRGKMMDAIRRLHRGGGFDGFDAFRDPEGFDRLMRRLAKHKWVVYSKKPFATSEHLFRYLGRYTHRVGIANSRLVAVDERQVTFLTKDGHTTTLAPVEFLRRLVQHILPPGFVKIRHYGLYAGANVRSRLARARELLPDADDNAPLARTWYELLLALVGHDVRVCPHCGADVIAHSFTGLSSRPASRSLLSERDSPPISALASPLNLDRLSKYGGAERRSDRATWPNRRWFSFSNWRASVVIHNTKRCAVSAPDVGGDVEPLPTPDVGWQHGGVGRASGTVLSRSGTPEGGRCEHGRT